VRRSTRSRQVTVPDGRGGTDGMAFLAEVPTNGHKPAAS
jgi:hypothetical protein